MFDHLGIRSNIYSYMHFTELFVAVKIGMFVAQKVKEELVVVLGHS